ncbi:MAG: hypothetical protein V3U71_12985 [Cocleimonas sp.]
MNRNLSKVLTNKISCIWTLNTKNINYLTTYPSKLYFFIPFLWLAPINSSHAEWVEYINNASVGITYSDNLNQSAFDSDEHTDRFITPSYTVGRYYQANDLTRVRLDLNLSANIHDEFDKLDSVNITGSTSVVHKLGVGFNKPWIRGKVSIGHKNAAVKIRDGTLRGLNLSAGKRITDRLSGQVGINYNKRTGGKGEVVVDTLSTRVFDIENKSISVNFDYLLSQRSQLSAALTHRNGEFDGACTEENAGIVLDNEDVKAITFDDVFKGCVYQLEGSGNSLRLRYSYALGRHSSVNVAYEKRDMKVDVLDYDTSLWNISYMYSK